MTTTDEFDEEPVPVVPSKSDDFDEIAFESIMGTKEGRALMLRYLIETGVFDDTFTDDPHKNAYNCGLRAFGLKLQDDLLFHTPDNYLTMMKERTDGN